MIRSFAWKAALLGQVFLFASRADLVLCVHADGALKIEPSSNICCRVQTGGLEEGCCEGCGNAVSREERPCTDCKDYSPFSLLLQSRPAVRAAWPDPEDGIAGSLSTAVWNFSPSLFPERGGLPASRPLGPSGAEAHLRTVILLL